jgi:hypothetical protein
MAHYFVSDCDNFIVPSTITKLLLNSKNGVIAPMLTTDSNYSNYHYDINNNGYCKTHYMYGSILKRTIKGLIQVPVVHCTYFINSCFLNNISYDDGSCRHEYVIFSDVLRKKGICQYLDNQTFYGYLEMTIGDTYKTRYDTIWKPFHTNFIMNV